MTLIIDFLHNENARSDWEFNLPIPVLLGFRVFISFCFPKTDLSKAKKILLNYYEFGYNSVRLLPLDQGSVLALAESVVPLEKRPLEIVWKRILEACGGNPLELEQLFRFLLHNNDPTFNPLTSNFKEVLSKLTEESRKRGLKLDIWSYDFKFVLYAALAGIPLFSNTEFVVDPTPRTLSLEDFESNGTIHFSKMVADNWASMSSYHCMIQMPFVVISSALRRSGEQLPQVLEKFLTEWTNDSSKIELIWFHQIVFRLYASSVLLKHSKLDSISPKIIDAFHLFYGSICSPFFKDLLFSPQERIDVYQAVNTDDFEEFNPLINLSDGNQINLNGNFSHGIAIKFSGSTHFDGVISTTYIPNQSKPEQSERILIWIDVVSNEKLKAADVLKRIEKFDKLKEKISDVKKQILLICSNRPSVPGARGAIQGGDVVFNGKVMVQNQR